MSDVREMNPVERASFLNPYSVGPTGQLRSFSEQYAQWALMKEEAGDLAAAKYSTFVLMLDCSHLDVPPLREKPLVMFPRTIRHLSKKHRESIPLLDGLAAEMTENLLVYQDPRKPSHYVFVLAEKDALGNRYIAALEAEERHNTIEVNKLSTVFSKNELTKHLCAALEAKRDFYVNERTGAWLKSSEEWEPGEHVGISLAKAIHRHLSELYCTRFPEKAIELGFDGEAVGVIDRLLTGEAFVKATFIDSNGSVREPGDPSAFPGVLAIFHDPDYDEPPVRVDASTFGITWMPAEAVLESLGGSEPNIWGGYSSDHDDDIDRSEAAKRIVEEGWVSASDIAAVRAMIFAVDEENALKPSSLESALSRAKGSRLADHGCPSHTEDGRSHDAR